MEPDEIKTLRLQAGLTVRDFAATLGINKGTVVDWELGRHKPRGLYLKALQLLAKRIERQSKG